MTGGQTTTNKRFGSDGSLMKVLCSEQFQVKDNIASYIEPQSKYIKNTFTISSGYSLEIDSNSSLSVEAQVDLANGGMGCGIMNFAQIINNGSITLKSGSTLKAIGKIFGSGKINNNTGATIYDLFKITSFAGGSALSKYALNLQSVSGVLDGIFPVNEYIFDNIQCTVDFYYGSKYYLLSPVNSNNSNIVEQMELIDTANSFFIYDSSEAPNGVVFSKIVKNGGSKVHLNSFTFNENSKIKIGYLKLNALGYELSSEKFNFPLSHIEIINNGSITIGKANNSPLKIEILPSSRVINNGTLIVKDGAQIGVCSFTAEQYSLLKDGKYHEESTRFGGSKKVWDTHKTNSSPSIGGVYQMLEASYGYPTTNDLLVGKAVATSGKYTYKYLFNENEISLLGFPNVNQRSLQVDLVNN